MPAPIAPPTIAAVGYVAVGGAVGSVARWYLSSSIAARFASWPYGTLFVNLTGSFLIGLFLALASTKFSWPEELRYLIPIGFIGGYTTFSAYEYETFKLLEQGRAMAAFAYVAISTVAGLAAVALGALCARRF